ncbi:MAG: hypothetical protein ACYC27_17920 [Armatimonadota bacterium]
MKQPKQQTDTRPRKRWIIIGPGIILAMILAIQIVISNRQKPSGPPIIERQVVGSEVTHSISPTPDVGYILERRDKLGLSDRQIKALVALQADWQSKSKPISDDLNQATREFDAFMEKAGNKATIRDIQSHAGPVSELSRQLSSLRRVYWEKAIQVLNKQQMQAINKELSRGYQPKPV